MKRIFILNDRVRGGGAEIVMKDIVNYLHGKYDITVMTFDDACEGACEVFPEGVKYIPSKIKRNPYRRRNPLHYLCAAYNFIRRVQIRSKKYDIAIANKEGPCMKFVSKMKADKKLAWVHVDYQYLYWTRGTFSAGDEVKCMQCFDKVVCVSEAACESVKKVIGDPGNLCVRYNPIDFEKIRQNADEECDTKRNEGEPLFVAVGRIAEQKNFITLARVCARLCKEFEFELWIVGDGEQREEIEKLLREEDCDCVKILGMQNNPHKYLSKADFLISAALCESYGLVIQEALALGIPVLTTRCPAIEECFDTKFGMIVDCNEESLENGLRSILENPECINEYKKKIENEYDALSLWKARLGEIENLIV